MAITYIDSDTALIPLSWNYVHENRELTANETLYKDIQDVKIINNTVVLLTNSDTLSSKVSNQKNDMGIPWNTRYSYYGHCIDEKESVDIASQDILDKSQYLIFIPFKTENFNILEMNKVKYDNDIWLNDTTGKKYVSFSYGNNQLSYEGNFVINYSTTKESLIFESDKITPFTQINDMASFYLSDSILIELGAIGGSCPENSDNIYWDQTGYRCFPYVGGNFNGSLKCSWLSASPSVCTGVDYQWMERWEVGEIPDDDPEYPNLDNTTRYIDIPSDTTIQSNETYLYNRFGPERNKEYYQTLLDSSIFSLTVDSETIYDSIAGTKIVNSGVTLSDNDLVFDGSSFLEIKNNVGMNALGSYTFGIGVKKDNWLCGKTHQIFGNYFKGGKGIFFNSGGYSSIITFGSENGIVHGFNYQIFKIFEKDMYLAIGENVTIDEIQTDSDYARWILDNTNHRIYKLEIDDVLTDKIILPSTSSIISMAIDQNNLLYILDSSTQTISYYSPAGDLLGTLDDIGGNNAYITFDLENNLIVESSTKIVVDKNNDIYSVRGSSVYKNAIRWFPLGNRISDIIVDKNNNIWISDETDLIKIVNSDGFLVDTIRIQTNISEKEKTFFGVNSFNNKTNCESEQIWILTSCSRTIIQYDLAYNLLDIIGIDEILGKRSCFDSTKFVIRGDFSGYDINRKKQIVNGEYITTFNPHITAKIKLSRICGGDFDITLNYPAKNLGNDQYHYFAIVHNYETKEFSLVIDGEIVDSARINGEYQNLNHFTSAYFIGTSSGKIGTENEERGLYDENYVGLVYGANVWNYPLTSWDILSLYNFKANKFNPLYWVKNIHPKNVAEKITKFHTFSVPGHRSNKFNLVIKGLDIPDTTKLIAEDYIRSQINNIKPAHTELNTIVWQ